MSCPSMASTIFSPLCFWARSCTAKTSAWSEQFGRLEAGASLCRGWRCCSTHHYSNAWKTLGFRKRSSLSWAREATIPLCRSVPWRQFRSFNRTSFESTTVHRLRSPGFISKKHKPATLFPFKTSSSWQPIIMVNHMVTGSHARWLALKTINSAAL